MILEIDEAGRFIGGVCLEPEHTEVALVSLAGRVLTSQRFATRRERAPKQVLIEAKGVLGALLSDRGVGHDRLLGIGWSVPGYVCEQNAWVDLAVVMGWEPFDMAEMLAKLVAEPCAVGSEGQLRALAEVQFGSHEPGGTVAYLSADLGVVSALIVDGRIYRGEHGDTGEIGHIPSFEGGPLCRCGRHGCLEARVSAPAVSSRIQYLARTSGDSALDELVELPEDQWLPQFFALAGDGHLLAERLAQEIARELAWGVAALIDLWDPGRVILAGEVFRSGGESLRRLVEEHTHEQSTHTARHTIPIATSSLGDESGVLGAAALVYEQQLHLPLGQRPEEQRVGTAAQASAGGSG